MAIRIDNASSETPSFCIAYQIRSCGTEPKAFGRSNHTRCSGRWRRLASSIMDRTRKECSRHPSPGTKPFCAGEIAPVSPAQQANRLPQMAAYTLYIAFCSEMGRQLLGNASSPFLKIRMVELFFQVLGIFFSRRQTSKIRARITSSGSMAFHTLYGSRSGPGAELDGSGFSCDYTSPGEMGIASHSAFILSSPRQSRNQSGGLSTSTSDREDSLLKKVWRSVCYIGDHSPPLVSPSRTAFGCGGTTTARAAPLDRCTSV